MATSTIVLLPACLLLLLALCGSSLEASTQGQDLSQQDAAAAARHNPSPLHAASLGRLLRARRSAELQAPPHYYRLAGLMGSPSKRDDGYWIWMPAHGYMSVPRDEVASSSGDKDSMGNLLRYGRK